MTNRRSFLKTTAFATASFAVAPYLVRAQDPGRKLNCVLIGCGGRGLSAHADWLVNNSKDNLVAIVDPDEKRTAEVQRWLSNQKEVQVPPEKVQVFTDYRRMFDKVGKKIDAVFIAAPNHHHAPAAMRGMDLHKAVYCEKPLCHDIAEARKLRKMAAKSKAPTQMGNQGHCEDGYRRLCEFVEAGVIGNITETHSWTDRANGGVGPRPPVLPVPAGLHWDEWIGPAPFRKFHTDIHPHEWHGWYDFGNGSLGNMGCHVLDGVYWALKLEHPTTLEEEEVRGGSNERYPIGSRLRFDFPARGNMPPVKVYWYEGLNQTADESSVTGSLHAAKGEARNLPPLLLELRKQYPDDELDKNDSGTLYVGEKGIIYTGTYGQRMHVVPMEKMSEINQPPRTLPRQKNIFNDFLTACREGNCNTAASFDYGARLTEFTLLGNLAQHAGVGRKIEWDGKKMKVKNIPELNEWLKRPYRKGW